jgi:hypothetical protein
VKAKIQGGEVGSENDPMLDSLTRLRKKLEREGKTLEDIVGEGKGKEGERKEPPIKVQ